jgi:hypothetical protein
MFLASRGRALSRSKGARFVLAITLNFDFLVIGVSAVVAAVFLVVVYHAFAPRVSALVLIQRIHVSTSAKT